MSLPDRRASPAQEGLDAAFIAAVLVMGGLVIFPQLADMAFLILVPVVVGFLMSIIARALEEK